VPTNAVEVINLISSGGLVTALLVILWAGATKRWCWGYQLDEKKLELLEKDEDLKIMRAERDIWIERTLRLTRVADTAVQTTKAMVQRVDE
jgi:hypothetical protein